MRRDAASTVFGSVLNHLIPCRRESAACIFLPVPPAFWPVWPRRNKAGTSLPARRQCIESSFQDRHRVQLFLEFVGHRDFRTFLQIHFQSRISLLQSLDGCTPSRRLPTWRFAQPLVKRICRGPWTFSVCWTRIPLGSFSSAFEEQKRAVFLESMDQDDVAFLKRIARMTPLQFFAQPAIENNPSQLLLFCLPRLGLAEIRIDLGVCLAHGIPLAHCLRHGAPIRASSAAVKSLSENALGCISPLRRRGSPPR